MILKSLYSKKQRVALETFAKAEDIDTDRSTDPCLV